MMNVAIIHYHLNRGGVTSVIANHVKALDTTGQPLRVIVLFGGRKQAWNDELADELTNVELSLHAVPALEYDDNQAPAVADLVRELRSALSAAGCTPDDTLLHIHNHSLGKNVSLPGAIRQLAEDGFRLLLQIHDFAEDIRPSNYARLQSALGVDLPTLLYPQAEQIHYSVLNRRDAGILEGITANERLHLLPNPAAEFGELPDREQVRRRVQETWGLSPQRRFVVSPVRGIRRKNIGETLLWSAVFGDNTTYAVTLPPLNPVEQSSYEFWRTTASELQLPLLFDVGSGDLTFPEVLAASDALISTSIAEGFGMAFLEAWLAGRPLIGRDLPDITADFKTAGINLDSLAPMFRIPLELVGQQRFEEHFASAFRELLNAHGRSIPGGAELAAAGAAHVRDGTIDFAALDRHLQHRVLSAVVENEANRDAIRSANPDLCTAADLTTDNAATTIAANATAIRSVYSVAGSGSQLLSAYAAALSSRCTPIQATDGEQILDEFLSAHRFHPLRCQP